MRTTTRTKKSSLPLSTPDIVLEYLAIREQLEVLEAKRRELEMEVIKWGVRQIKEECLTSKTLRIPELTESCKELVIRETRNDGKTNKEVKLLDEAIDYEREIASSLNKTEIDRLLHSISLGREELAQCSNTDRGRELEQKKKDILELLPKKKELQLRRMKCRQIQGNLHES